MGFGSLSLLYSFNLMEEGSLSNCSGSLKQPDEQQMSDVIFFS